MQIGLGIGITQLQRRGGGGFSPAVLFASGEQGVWFEPSPDTCFTDTAGTTPADVGDAVARINDSSGNGNHATQPTAAARPTYGIVPETGRRNLLGYTEQFDNAAWNKSTGFVITANNTTAPDGTSSADLVTVTSPGSSTSVNRLYSPSAGDHTATVYLKYSTAQWVQVWFGSASFGGGHANFDLINGVIGDNFLGAATMTSVGDGWYRCSLTRTATASGATAVCATVPVSSGSAVRFGSEVSGSYFIWGAQLEEGSTATAYQAVTSQFDVTEAGVPSLGYLSFDGVDDVLISPSAVFFGEASSMMVGAESFSGSGARTVGTDLLLIGLLVRETIATIGFVNNYTNGSGAISTGTSFSNKRVCSWLRSQSQNSALLRFDGAGVASTTHDQADNNSRPLAVGGNTTRDYGAMNFFSLVHIARFINEAELSRTERYIAQKTGVDLT